MVEKLLFAKESISSKRASVANSPTEALFVGINLRKKKWLLSCSYSPHRENRENQPETLIKSLALHSSSYENLITVGDFNDCVEKFCVSDFVMQLASNVLHKNF